MTRQSRAFGAALFFSTMAATAAYADTSPVAMDHAPIGVMADHMHEQGEFMLSYRYMYMAMEDNRIGTDNVTPEFIVSNVPNRTGMPPTLRVVPTEMTMQMHMIGLMYAPTDWLTLMGMGMIVTKEMDHITFAGPSGTTQLGTFETESAGIGDTSVSGLIRLTQEEHLNSHLKIGLSLPTGSIEREDEPLTPMNTRPTLRLPYAMQLGSGTFDLLPGFTISNRTHDGKFGGGAQYEGVIRLDENDEGYALGDRHKVTGWVQYAPDPSLALSLRLAAESIDKIEGFDPLIGAPIQTANPDFYGGDIVEAGAGVTFLVPDGQFKGYRFAGEVMVPLSRDLNGPQLETDLTFTFGIQKAW